MSTRKHLRNRVRARAARRGMKPSRVVRRWRDVLDIYPDFKGLKRQKPGSIQPILKYPVPKKGGR